MTEQKEKQQLQTETEQAETTKKEEKQVQTLFKTRAALRQRYLQLKDELDLGGEEMFEQMISTLALNNTIELVPDAKAQIREFERHTQALIDLYQVQLQYGFESGERVRNDLRAEIEEKDAINNDLQIQIKNLKTELNAAKAAAEQAAKNADDQAKWQKEFLAEVQKTIEDNVKQPASKSTPSR